MARLLGALQGVPAALQLLLLALALRGIQPQPHDADDLAVLPLRDIAHVHRAALIVPDLDILTLHRPLIAIPQLRRHPGRRHDRLRHE